MEKEGKGREEVGEREEEEELKGNRFSLPSLFECHLIEGREKLPCFFPSLQRKKDEGYL